jgi:hypothetical protein
MLKLLIVVLAWIQIWHLAFRMPAHTEIRIYWNDKGGQVAAPMFPVLDLTSDLFHQAAVDYGSKFLIRTLILNVSNLLCLLARHTDVVLHSPAIISKIKQLSQ